MTVSIKGRELQGPVNFCSWLEETVKETKTMAVSRNEDGIRTPGKKKEMC